MATDHCSDCFKGTFATTKPTGTTETIHDLPTYIARPEGTPKGLIVIISDAFGWEFVNNRVLADAYAKEGGFLVYLPDFFLGHGASLEFIPVMTNLEKKGFLATLLKPFFFIRLLMLYIPFAMHNKLATIRPRLFSWFQALRKDPTTANMKIFPAGFCWGGKYTALLAQDKEEDRVVRPGGEVPEKLIDAGYTAHPSSIKVKEDIVPITLPMSIAVGDVDQAMPLKMVEEVQGILTDKTKHEIVVYPGAKHGFAVRGDEMDEKMKVQMMDSKKQALNWFQRWSS